MFKNYLTVALRNLRKHKGYSLLNLAGLALGMTCCLLIMLYVQDELSYDRFHPKAERIYRVVLDAGIGGQFIKAANTAAPMAATLVAEVPEVEAAARFWRSGRVLLGYENNRFYEENFLWADSSAFAVFGFPLLQGDARTALAQPNTVVLTSEMARKYFGVENPVGKILRYDNRLDLKITGVLQDVPRNSHLRFDFLGAMVSRQESQSPIWISNNYYTYLLLREGATPQQLEAKFPALVKKYVAPQIERAIGKNFDEAVAAGAKWGYFLQSVTSIYLHSKDLQYEIGVTSDAKYVYILGAIAVFILLIACINFMNLATARASKRAKEVGLRKVLGSERTQLIKQFLGEALLLAFMAMLVALTLMELLLPNFNQLADKALSINGDNVVMMIATLFGIMLVAGVLAGLYPAFVLSAFQPVAVLKGALRGGMKSPRLRSTLVIAQFAISIVLLVSTGVVFEQLRFMREKNLGFQKEQVVLLPIETAAGQAKFESLRGELLRHPHVVAVAASSSVPGRIFGDNAHHLEGAPPEIVYSLQTLWVSFEYLDMMEIPLVAGRGFSSNFPTDSTSAFIINETAVRHMGFTPESAVGQRLTALGGTPDQNETRTIVGVIKDFHFESLHLQIKPMVLSINPRQFGNISVRIRPENISATIGFLQEQWQAFEPGYPWRYSFLDDDFGRLFQREARLSQIFGLFTLLAIFIACLGLFGLASFVAEQRTKEIGVRKVLGATVQSVVMLLTKEFTKLVAFSFILAAPIAYFVMQNWLQDFAYRTALNPLLFLAAGVLALVIAWLTVSYQALRAALTNPVEALRYE